jgi:hypothetical protein
MRRQAPYQFGCGVALGETYGPAADVAVVTVQSNGVPIWVSTFGLAVAPPVSTFKAATDFLGTSGPRGELHGLATYTWTARW